VDAVLSVVPELGGLGVFVVVLYLLIRREVQTTERHGAELDRLIRTHDAEMAEKVAELATVRQQRDLAEQQLRETWQRRQPMRDPPTIPRA
jgi:hypothetical protein